jgi:predicted nucleic acid-binding protein
MNAPIFVDTNVLVYARDATEPRRQSLAADWLLRLWTEHLGRTSVQVLSEYYVTVARKLKPGLKADEAWDDVRAFLAWEPQEIDRELLSRAREVEKRHALSWWDSMVVAAAQLQDCRLLLTEDLQDGRVYDDVTICSPFTTTLGEQRGKYEIAPRPVSRHRRRGRPRRAA